MNSFIFLFISCNGASEKEEGAVKIDSDMDGYALEEDCDDQNEAIYPGAQEICDNVDNNCDGEIDEEVQSTYYADSDGDGFGNPDVSILACEAGAGFVEDGTDCNDAAHTANPQAQEICDGIDNDCNEEIDEGLMVTFYVDEDQDGIGNAEYPVEACDLEIGLSSVSGDCNDSDPDISPLKTEICDGIDNNCNEEIDEDVLMIYYRDFDNDGFGDETQTQEACEPPVEYVSQAGDCDDTESYAHPNAIEICDDMDNDCDGAIDEPDAVGEISFYTDGDGDGFGDDLSLQVGCTLPSDGVLYGGDCDDSEATANPAMVELCDGIDNDCDGSVDEAGAFGELIAYTDLDGDGFGDDASAQTQCSLTSGTVAQGGDCDDAEETANPAMVELCDGIDNDCDSIIDGSDSIGAVVFYDDIDLDGYGDDATQQTDCSLPSGATEIGGDCDDGDPNINPGQSEIGYDGIDNDCDTTSIDETIDLLLHMDGTSGQFFDSSGNDWAVVGTGGVSQTTSQSVFGGSSTYFDGSNDRLEVEDVDWSFGLEDFTIDMWVWVATHRDMGMLTTQDPATGTGGWMIDFDLNGNSGQYGLQFKVGNDYILRDSGGIGGSYPIQTWVHVAIIRHNGTFTSYMNGNSVSSSTTSVSIEDNSIFLRVGQRGTTGDWFEGYIDEVRIVKGSALWTTNFTPPTAPAEGPGE